MAHIESVKVMLLKGDKGEKGNPGTDGKDGEIKNLDQIKPIIIDTFYPVGSLYTSINYVNPNTWFGGTWERVTDTVLMARGDNLDNYFVLQANNEITSNVTKVYVWKRTA